MDVKRRCLAERRGRSEISKKILNLFATETVDIYARDEDDFANFPTISIAHLPNHDIIKLSEFLDCMGYGCEHVNQRCANARMPSCQVTSS